MAVHETLFSLEVAVECIRVSLHNVTCRCPTVAFRLLDFPTLLVHHVEPEDTSKIKDSIFIDQEINGIPLQLRELKDHKGNFVLKKGKSCMFKMDLATLQTHLCNAPLYVMLVDTWPDVAKLVASCTVSLQGVIQSICSDVQQSGIEMPSVHGVRGSYKLFNLMGSEIGWIVLGIRLLSLGGSLMPHIPQASLVTRQSSGDGGKINQNVPAVHGPKTDHIIVENLDVDSSTNRPAQIIHDDEKKQPVMAPAISSAENVEKRDHHPVKTSMTQTEKVKSKKKLAKYVNPQISLLPDLDDGLIISNTHCPPPLFFNADVPENASEDIGVQKNVRHRTKVEMGTSIANDDPIHANEVINTSIVSNITSSEETSISSREQYTETHYRYQSEAAGQMQTVSVRKTHRKQTAKHHVKSAPGGDYDESQVAPSNLLIHSQMPILTALLQELSMLHGGSGSMTNVPKAQTDSQHPSNETQMKPSLTPGEQGNLLQAVFSIPKQQSPYRHKHDECVRTPRPVPSKKSWLRREPKPSKLASKPKTKLRFGMTNTQKLRLRKNNPELLKHLEEQDAKVRSYRESLTQKVQKKEAEVAASDDLDVSTEIGRHQEQHGETSGVDRQRKTRDDVSVSELVTSMVKKPIPQSQNAKQRPVPSPRTPRAITGLATFKWNEVERQQMQDEEGDTDDSDGVEYKDDSTGDSIEVKDSRPGTVTSSEKSVKSGRSIDVYLPTSTMEDSFHGHEEDSLLLPESPQIPPRSIPGFPSVDSTLQNDDDVKASPSLYSANFESSKNLESTGEQDLPALSQSSSNTNRSAKSRLDSSEGSHSTGSFSSERSERSKPSVVSVKDTGDQPRPAARLHTGFSVPKPLMSTRSPVPLAVRRSSRPSLQIQVPSDIQETDADRSEPRTPPTPKPRRHTMLSGSAKSSEYHSTSEFSSKNSDRDDHKAHEYDSYSEDFSSSDSN